MQRSGEAAQPARFRLHSAAVLPLSFYRRDTIEVARDLLGRVLCRRRVDGTILRARLVEVEAYDGPEDRASHASRGRTPRNAQMFETPGRLYVYFTYGMHHCMNVVCERHGCAGAVLLRAGEPLDGEELMERRRGRGGVELSNGPAKLCQALGVDLSWNGVDLLRGRLGLWPGVPPRQLGRSGRIGIRHAGQLPYRYYDSDSRYLSRARPAHGPFDQALGG